MFYEKTNWKNGDIITAQKLNKIENNIEKFFFCSKDTSTGLTLGETTYNDIKNAVDNGKLPILIDPYNYTYYYYLKGLGFYNDVYYVQFGSPGSTNWTWSSSSTTGTLTMDNA